MPKAKFNDIVNNPGLRHIAIKIFSYLDYVDYSSRYDDDSSFDSLDFEDYDPYASYGDLQTDCIGSNDFSMKMKNLMTAKTAFCLKSDEIQLTNKLLNQQRMANGNGRISRVLF